MKKLSADTIEEALNSLEGWTYKNNALHKKFVFEDFVEAFGFLGRVALISEQLTHHPNWSGVYNKVELRLSTHDAGGVTKKDLEFAERVESYET